MTKSIFIAAALVAAVAFTADASAATRHLASRHAQATATTGGYADCVRAPDVGAFATAPYSVPPCMPGTAN